MRKKIFIDRSIPRKALPDEFNPDWIPSAVAVTNREFEGKLNERSLHIPS